MFLPPGLSYRRKCRTALARRLSLRRDGNDQARLPDVFEGVVDRTLLWPAFMLFKIGLELCFGFIGVRYEFPSRSEC
jgi:hypothetical protein